MSCHRNSQDGNLIDTVWTLERTNGSLRLEDWYIFIEYIGLIPNKFKTNAKGSFD